MYQKIKEIIRILALPILFLIVFFSLTLIWQIFGFPNQEQLIVKAQEYFDRYGNIVVFISATIEGMFGLGFYFPGGFIIFVGAIVVGRDITKLIPFGLLATLGFLIGYTLDYIIGKYGWYRLFIKLGLKDELIKAEKRLTKHGARAIFLTYWEVNLAALTATAAGILRYPYSKFIFYSIPAALLWNIFWVSVIYVSGEAALTLVSSGKIAISIGVIWMLILLIRHHLKKGVRE